MRCAILVALAAAVLGGPIGVHAQPTIQVRARAFLDGLQAASRGRAVTVEGALRDNLGAPVAGGEVEVLADGQPVERVRTGPDGRFLAQFELEGAGERRLEVRYAGSPLLDRAEARLPIVVGRNALRLRIDAPDEVDVGRPVGIGVAAFDGREVPVPGLRLGLDLDGQPLRSLRTDRSGRAEVQLPPLEPGEHTLRVHFAGSAIHLPAEAERRIEAARPLALALAAASAEPPGPGDPVVLDVTLGADRPGEVRVTLTAEGRPIADRAVSADGARFVVDADDLEPGPVRFRALAHAEAAGWQDAASEVVTIEVPPPPPPSPWWIRAPAILAGVSLLGVLVRVRRRPRAAPPPPVVAPSGPPPFTFEASAGPAASGRLVVVVRDGLDGRPLRARLVRLARGAPPPTPGEAVPPSGERVETDAEGRAALGGDGDRLWAHAPGYAPSCHPLPRQGGRAVIHLLPVRARMQTLYAEVLAAAGRPPLRFGRETPREAAEALGGRGAPGEPLGELTALVERACFGARAPDEGDLVEALRLAQSVRRGLGNAPTREGRR